MASAPNHRSERIGEYITRELSTLLLTRVNDPRCEGTRITNVRLSSDYSYAKIFVLFRDETEQVIQEGLKGLKKAKGFLRSELAKHMTMRRVPELQFVFDESVPYGAQLSALIDTAIEADEYNQRQNPQD